MYENFSSPIQEIHIKIKYVYERFLRTQITFASRSKMKKHSNAFHRPDG
ncbi:hypothetical protein SAMN05216436_102103 [bacterium A37T11]|nr:hypothetical protein SAMN05216436_102103 [bacterium A37T11]